MEGLNAGLRKALFKERRCGIGVGALEPHQRGPIDPHLAGPHPLASHPLDGINGFAGTHEHLFGMTAPQCTGPAKRPRVNDGHGPSRGTTARRHDGRAGACANHDDIVLFLHTRHSFTAPPSWTVQLLVGREYRKYKATFHAHTPAGASPYPWDHPPPHQPRARLASPGCRWQAAGPRRRARTGRVADDGQPAGAPRRGHTEHHRCVDVAHVGYPERAALQITNPAAKAAAALLATIVAE